ncbi:MAG: hypothetical protein FGM58_01565 [Acidimicrobiia bacterium]|nr:hypothetical protein [Acidimicrobiia bacterium]
MIRRPVLVSLLLALALAVAACGGGSPAAEDTTTTTPTLPPTTVAPTTTTTVDPGTLPQTDEKPAGSGATFDARMKLLADAIIANDPDLALTTFFPLAAYKQIKAINDPASDWQGRLVGAFRTDVAKANAQLGPNARAAKFLGVRVPDTAVWVTPGQEYNKGPYWRVFKSQMDFSVDGRTVSVPIESMISWRGQWYVVHLGAFR